MDAFDRFADLMRRPASGFPLDEACLLIAAQVCGDVDVASQLARLDHMAAQVREHTLEGLRGHLFGRMGFRGDAITYRDPVNSLLHRVLDRKQGIPIVLSVVTIEVGRRLGIRLDGIGLPGHFLVGDATDPDRFVDPFAIGAVLDRNGCRRLFQRIHGPVAQLEDAHLRPTPPAAIVARVLQNLRLSYLGAKDRDRLIEVLRLRTVVPGVPRDAAGDLADALARTGRFAQAAAELERLAQDVPDEADQLQARARQLRARLN